jgi:ABC-type uncharacterized transport system permease subunit
MANNIVLSLTALLALVPASLLPYRRAAARPDLLFWSLLAVAVAGPAVASLVQFAGSWQTGLAGALWISTTASAALFAVLAALSRDAWRLAPLLLPYLCLLAALAVIWGRVPPQGEIAAAPGAWLAVHIVVSVATYALSTLAAVASCAVLVQERALKRKQPGPLSRSLPAIVDAERLELRLLMVAELVLGAGIVTGMTLQYLASGELLAFDHKTVLSLLAFAIIGTLLVLQLRSGLRGRRAARLVLAAYLLLTLAYPGVKLVTDVLIG